MTLRHAESQGLGLGQSRIDGSQVSAADSIQFQSSLTPVFNPLELLGRASRMPLQQIGPGGVIVFGQDPFVRSIRSGVGLEETSNVFSGLGCTCEDAGIPSAHFGLSKEQRKELLERAKKDLTSGGHISEGVRDEMKQGGVTVSEVEEEIRKEIEELKQKRLPLTSAQESFLKNRGESWSPDHPGDTVGVNWPVITWLMNALTRAQSAGLTNDQLERLAQDDATSFSMQKSQICQSEVDVVCRTLKAILWGIRQAAASAYIDASSGVPTLMGFVPVKSQPKAVPFLMMYQYLWELIAVKLLCLLDKMSVGNRAFDWQAVGAHPDEEAKFMEFLRCLEKLGLLGSLSDMEDIDTLVDIYQLPVQQKSDKQDAERIINNFKESLLKNR